MRIGLIARCERGRGLAIQSLNFYEHMPVDKVLLVRMPTPDAWERPEWYPTATHIKSLPNHTLDEEQVRAWMEGLDIVFTVETPYDWSLPRWAREMGVKLAIQGNPEFIRHGQPEYAHHEHPDAWWWPTTWRINSLPAGKHMPVPMPDHDPSCASPYEAGPLKAFHVTGKRAFADRNGTEIVMNCLRALNTDVEFTMFGLDNSLPEIGPMRNTSLIVRNEGVEDRWQMYEGQHLLVLPRRYGGLCLPALEAASRGCAVMMTDVTPNGELAQHLVPVNWERRINVAAGQIGAAEVGHVDLAAHISSLGRDRDRLALYQQRAYLEVPRWSRWRGVYLAEMERICS